MRLSGTGNNCGNGRRKISNEACEALMNCRKYRNSNTRVFPVEIELEVPRPTIWIDWIMTLFGNNIATYLWNVEANCRQLYICDGGHQSVTTKERLNALPNVNIYQKNYQWYLNDKKWDGNSTRIITPAEELIDSCTRCVKGKMVTDNESGEMFCSKCGQTTKELEEARQISHMEKVQSAYEKLRNKAI